MRSMLHDFDSIMSETPTPTSSVKYLTDEGVPLPSVLV